MSQNEEPQISYTDEPIDKLEGRWGEGFRSPGGPRPRSPSFCVPAISMPVGDHELIWPETHRSSPWTAQPT